MNLARLIQSHRAEILKCWMAGASRAAAARGLEGPEFTNLIPTYLASLALADGQLGELPPERKELVEGHLSTRLRQGFQAGEIVEEFALLGRCIIDLSNSLPADERLSPHEAELVLSELHLASVVVTDAFTRHMLEDEQVEKRYLRLVQATALKALEGDGSSVNEMLKSVLSLIMEATGAQSAALWLADVDGRGRGVVVSVGAANEEKEPPTWLSDQGTFTGQVASREQATWLLDCATTELKVSEALRTSGIHSLLGVRLVAGEAIRGVLYVGMAQVRSFSSREVRRLESLGYQLLMHLETARLQTALRERVEALRAERAVRESIVSVIAHDLRGPLSTAKMGAQMLRLGGLAEPQLGVAVKIERNLERLDRMIRDLLDTNRIRAGERLTLHPERCDLVALVRAVIDDLALAHGPRFELVADGPVEGYFGCDELSRALWNLATNAVKYGAEGTPVKLIARRQGESAQLSVHNEGPPIPQAEQAQLFEPYKRARSAEAGRERGWGLGLSLVRGCAEAHGGSVSVRSSPGEGTTFTMSLPLDARPHQPPGAASAPGGEAKGASVH